tara:strand:+ start:1280 stop:1714 length:435 start_codon:yes stop_codon:yes gene_type:complete
LLNKLIKTKRGLRRKVPRKYHRVRKPARKKITFVCFQGEWSGAIAKEFRKFLREQGLANRVEVKGVGVKLTGTETRHRKGLENADIVVSPISSEPLLFKNEVGDIKRLAPNARMQEVYTHSDGGFDIERTFNAILKEVIKRKKH